MKTMINIGPQFGTSQISLLNPDDKYSSIIFERGSIELPIGKMMEGEKMYIVKRYSVYRPSLSLSTHLMILAFQITVGRNNENKSN